MRESIAMTPHHHRISLPTPKERRAEKHPPQPPYFSLPVVLTWGEASVAESGNVLHRVGTKWMIDATIPFGESADGRDLFEMAMPKNLRLSGA